MIEENPFYPFDPRWYDYEILLRRKWQSKISKEILEEYKKMRAKYTTLIFTTPKENQK